MKRCRGMEMLYKGLVFQIANSVIFVACSYCIHFSLGHIMTPTEYGIWGIILVVLDFEYLFVNNGVRQAVAREVAYKKYDVRDLIKKSVKLQIMLAGGLSAVTVLASGPLAGIFHEQSLSQYLKAAALIVPFTGLYVITEGIHNGLLLLEREAVIGILYSLFKLSIIPFAMYTGLDAVEAAELGFGFAAFAGLLLGSISLYQKKKMIYKRAEKINFVRFIKSAMNYSVFFIMVSVALSVDTLILRYFIEDSEVIGYYTGAVNFGKITYYILTAFFLVILPIITDLYSQNQISQLKESVYSLILLINVFVLPVTVLLMATGRNLLCLFYGINYTVGAVPMALLSLSDFFLGMIVVLNMIMEAMGRKKFPAIEAICMLLVDIGLVSFLTRRMGMVGTALAGCCCTFFFLMVSGTYLIKLLGRIFDAKIFISIILCGLYGAAIWWLFQKIDIEHMVKLLAVYVILYLAYIVMMYLAKVFDFTSILRFLKAHK